MIRRPPRSTQSRSSAASDVYKRQTWCKDSHGLFDYESKALDIKRFFVEQSSSILREGEDILIVPRSINRENSSSPHRKRLLSVTGKSTPREEQFYIDPSEIQHEEGKHNEVYLIVRSLKNADGAQRGFTLVPGQVIKLGRMEFRVIECCYRNREITKLETDLDQEREFRQSTSQATPEAANSPVCRICLVEDDSDHKLIAPCKCRGSCEYVHLSCFQYWFKSKIQTKEYNNAWNFHWKKLECEVCQDPIPRLFKMGGERHELFNLKRPQDTPYLILESITKEKKAGRAIHVLRVGEEGVKLGRGHQCDVRIGDISVSRLHAEIKYQNDSFLITDNNSKFGTLVLLQEPYLIREEKVAVQVGRTVITFVMRPRSSLTKPKVPKQQKTQALRNIPGGAQFNVIDVEHLSPSQGVPIETENIRILEPTRMIDRRMEEEPMPQNNAPQMPVLPVLFPGHGQQLNDPQNLILNQINQLFMANYLNGLNGGFLPPSTKGPFN
eukprot:TRINITY_DN10563_c0_g2_i2.p1 TRINITY_DN10563_c0_g2~~TRINITY_DN10563_c0_g2_i2.p1  ORF type:complete len:497 (+),score=83.83 TRINITY_DN10563_c0_g2_i2:37-1527(+)